MLVYYDDPDRTRLLQSVSVSGNIFSVVPLRLVRLNLFFKPVISHVIMYCLYILKLMSF